jgi:hypothetical protein
MDPKLQQKVSSMLNEIDVPAFRLYELPSKRNPAIMELFLTSTFLPGTDVAAHTAITDITKEQKMFVEFPTVLPRNGVQIKFNARLIKINPEKGTVTFTLTEQITPTFGAMREFRFTSQKTAEAVEHAQAEQTTKRTEVV